VTTPAPMTTAPTINMPYGKAWRLNLAAVRRKTGRADAGVDAWLVEAEWAHSHWHSYFISLIHLRPTPGLLLPKVYVPHATHEFVLHALDPAGDRDRLLSEGVGSWCPCLTPANFAAQFIEATDDLARERIRDAVERICAGSLSPDTDFTRQWVRLFGSGMLREWAR
jgi:hypothetical protein